MIFPLQVEPKASSRIKPAVVSVPRSPHRRGGHHLTSLWSICARSDCSHPSPQEPACESGVERSIIVNLKSSALRGVVKISLDAGTGPVLGDILDRFWDDVRWIVMDLSFALTLPKPLRRNSRHKRLQSDRYHRSNSKLNAGQQAIPEKTNPFSPQELAEVR